MITGSSASTSSIVAARAIRPATAARRWSLPTGRFEMSSALI
jgi:hypothetical protein